LLKNTQKDISHEPYDFFLSKVWIDYYFSQWPDTDLYGVFTKDADVLACLSLGIFQSRLLLKYRSLGLNVSSSRTLKNVTLESNGAVGDSAQSLIAHFPSMLKILSLKSDWDEIRVDALLEKDAQEISAIARAQGLKHYITSEQNTYSVDLEKIRTDFNSNFLASRSSNTRAQLRKALRITELEIGKVELQTATSVSEAQDWLTELASLHKLRWSQNGEGEGFDNPFFYKFQRGLVEIAFHNEALQMMRLVAGNTTLAYLYNFLYKGQVLFYTIGAEYRGTEHFKPGMLTHWFAIEHSLSAGAKSYDFLAGTNRYKESLCTNTARRVSLVLRRPTLLFKLEHWLRQIKHNNNRVETAGKT
jgi:Acetyltransferase (GNAT) domain